MRFIFDTNTLVFLLKDSELLSKEVKKILENYDNLFYISSLSIVEILHLAQNKRISMKFKTANELIKIIENEYFINIIQTKNEHLNTFFNLPVFSNHNDPVDRFIIAQAITEKMTIISSDRKFSLYKNLSFIYNDPKAN